MSTQNRRKPDLLYIKFYWWSVDFVHRLCAALEGVRRFGWRSVGSLAEGVQVAGVTPDGLTT